MRRTGKYLSLPFTATTACGGGEITKPRSDKSVMSGIATLLPEKIQLFLHDLIGIAEQHRIRLSFQFKGMPTGDDKMVARPPIEALPGNMGDAAAFHHRKHRPRCRTVNLTAEAFGQQLHGGGQS